MQVKKTEKDNTQCGSKTIRKKTFGCYNSLLKSHLMNHKAIWSNYMRIDIELFEELFNLVETQISKKSLPQVQSGAYGCKCVVLRN